MSRPKAVPASDAASLLDISEISLVAARPKARTLFSSAASEPLATSIRAASPQHPEHHHPTNMHHHGAATPTNRKSGNGPTTTPGMFELEDDDLHDSPDSRSITINVSRTASNLTNVPNASFDGPCVAPSSRGSWLSGGTTSAVRSVSTSIAQSTGHRVGTVCSVAARATPHVNHSIMSNRLGTSVAKQLMFGSGYESRMPPSPPSPARSIPGSHESHTSWAGTSATC
jgi:hypothetical protein